MLSVLCRLRNVTASTLGTSRWVYVDVFNASFEAVAKEREAATSLHSSLYKMGPTVNDV